MMALLRWALDARIASHLGALLAGEPQFGDRLECIARRESRLELVGVHAGDAWMARTLGEGWSTRGVHGLVARYSLPAWWPWPAVLDVPLVSAYFATRRAHTWQCRQTKRCYTWATCRTP